VVSEKAGQDKALSPIIGVLLMVTMTIMLAFVVIMFVYSTGLSKQAPHVSIRAVSAEPTLDYVKLEHMGGSDIILKDVKLIVQNSISRVSWTNLNSTAAIMRAHDTLFVYTNGISGTEVYLNGNAATGTAMSAVGNMGSVDIAGGDIIYIIMIDVPSSRMIAELRVTV